MAHVAKYNKSAVGRMFAHYARKNRTYSNESIDPERTHLNYNLANHGMSQIDFLHQRLSEVKVQNRKDVNVMCDWILTAPKDLPEEDLKRFFSLSFDFFSQRYGKENVISANVHMDETTPHMHFAFVPVTEDKRKGGYKVSAKEVLTRSDLQCLHGDLKHYLENALGYQVNVLNGATNGKNKEIQELKAQSAKEKAEKAEEELAKLEEKIEPLKSLQVTKQKLTEEGKNIPLTKKVAINKEIYNTIIEQALAYIANRDEIDNLRSEKMQLFRKTTELEQKEHELQERANAVYKKESIVRNREEKQKNINEILDKTEWKNGELKEQVSDLKSRLNSALQERDAERKEYSKQLSEKETQIEEHDKHLQATKNTIINVLKTTIFVLSALREYVANHPNLTNEEKALFQAIEDLSLQHTSKFGYNEELLKKAYQNIKSEGRSYAKPLQEIIEKSPQKEEKSENQQHTYRKRI
ncbi:MAG: plasmid recombination protein [Ruminococcus sp.]|nr:plasmid recombination protein [Ruminococcus sp.]